MDNPQYYQPLSHALHPPLTQATHPPQQQHYASYASHAHQPVPNGAVTNREEEEEEEDDEEVVEEELEHHEPDTQAQTTTQAAASAQSVGSATATTHPTAAKQAAGTLDQSHSTGDVDESGKRRPGRPRGSRNRKPRAAPGTANKAPANSQHPGFYQYPPAPAGGALTQNQQFYEFQWRALNLCSEFYNAAEELVKAASPIVIAQCYQMGPATKIDPLAMIAEAKRICDNLLANPSQLVGQAPPPVYSMTYPGMAPPPTATAPTSSTQTGSVITNAQSFVMPLGSTMAPPANPYYPPHMYTAPTARYPTTPYYSYPTQPTSYYAPQTTQPQPQPQPQSTSATSTQSTPAPAPAPAAPPSTTGTISTFNAATGTTAPGGQQGTWSEEETERLRKLAEQSRDMGGPQNKGEIEWDWVIQQWGNTRTRHQILLKATSMGLKESTTRGTKRRREAESVSGETNEHTTTPASHAPPPTSLSAPVSTVPVSHQAPLTSSVPSASPVIRNQTTPSASTNASPAMPPQRPPSSTTQQTIAPARTTTTASPVTSIAPARTTTQPTTATSASLPWPMPTVAANTPSPVMANAQVDQQRSNYYRPRPTQAASYPGNTSTNAYAPPTTSTATSYGVASNNSTAQRPQSSHGSGVTATHNYMYRPNGTNNPGRRDGAYGSERDPALPFRIQPSDYGRPS